MLIIISPVIKQAGGNIIKNSIDTFYKDYSSAYYKNNADNTNEYSFTVRDVVIKTVRLQVAEVLGEYNRHNLGNSLTALSVRVFCKAFAFCLDSSY